MLHFSAAVFLRTKPKMSHAERARQERIAREKRDRDVINGWADSCEADSSLDEFVCASVYGLGKVPNLTLRNEAFCSFAALLVNFSKLRSVAGE